MEDIWSRVKIFIDKIIHILSVFAVQCCNLYLCDNLKVRITRCYGRKVQLCIWPSPVTSAHISLHTNNANCNSRGLRSCNHMALCLCTLLWFNGNSWLRQADELNSSRDNLFTTSFPFSCPCAIIFFLCDFKLK